MSDQRKVQFQVGQQVTFDIRDVEQGVCDAVNKYGDAIVEDCSSPNHSPMASFAATMIVECLRKNAAGIEEEHYSEILNSLVPVVLIWMVGGMNIACNRAEPMMSAPQTIQ
jgi:hypothetical protein